jgi:RNA-directed DNA polymerase
LTATLQRINDYLMRWAMRKFKRLRRRWRRARRFIADICQRDPDLFVHWRHGFRRSGWTL